MVWLSSLACSVSEAHFQSWVHLQPQFHCRLQAQWTACCRVSCSFPPQTANPPPDILWCSLGSQDWLMGQRGYWPLKLCSDQWTHQGQSLHLVLSDASPSMERDHLAGKSASHYSGCGLLTCRPVHCLHHCQWFQSSPIHLALHRVGFPGSRSDWEDLHTKLKPCPPVSFAIAPDLKKKEDIHWFCWGTGSQRSPLSKTGIVWSSQTQSGWV